MCADNAPKVRRVIGFDEVSEFMHNHVVDYEHRRFDETPVEADVVVRRAGAPPKTIIHDLSRSELHAKLPCMPFRADTIFSFARAIYHSRNTLRRLA